jgi:hypothetical protein
MIRDAILIVIGMLLGGVAAAMSAKYLGFFQKQVASVEKKV